mmetsp:Transcript_29163/g.56266  ORF Transcript_29163/g.56266 Transcript_29163/m.56266 type:complete len:393 (+) Transcript_29163:1631-2809(+)
MCVDVVDVFWLKTRLFQRSPHGALAPFASLGRRGDVIRITRQTITQNFGVDLCTTRFSVLIFFQHDNARTLAHDKAVTVRIIGTAGFGWIVCTTGRQCFTGVESRDANLTDRRFTATGYHDVRVIRRNQTSRVTNRVRASGTGGHNRVVWTFEAVFDAHLTRDQVNQRTRDKKRRHTTRAFFSHQQRGLFNRLQTTDARANHHTSTFQRLGIFWHPATVFHSHLRRRSTIKYEVVHFTTLFWRHPIVWVKCAIGTIAIRHLTGIFGGDTLRIKSGDSARTGLSVQNTSPTFFHTRSQRSNEPKPGDNNTTHFLCPSSEVFCGFLPRFTPKGQERRSRSVTRCALLRPVSGHFPCSRRPATINAKRPPHLRDGRLIFSLTCKLQDLQLRKLRR